MNHLVSKNCFLLTLDNRSQDCCLPQSNNLPFPAVKTFRMHPIEEHLNCKFQIKKNTEENTDKFFCKDKEQCVFFLQ